MYSGAKKVSGTGQKSATEVEAAGIKDLMDSLQSPTASEVVPARSSKLPVPKLVEPNAPSFPEVEPKQRPSRAAEESSTGPPNKTKTNLKANPIPSGKGNAAKIYPADVPRGESLANFGSTTGDAQNYDHRQQFANKSDSGA